MLSHGLDLDDVPGLEEVSALIANKSLVAYVKKSKFQSKLEKTVKQEVSTRWNSVLTMMQSIQEELEQLRKLAGKLV